MLKCLNHKHNNNNNRTTTTIARRHRLCQFACGHAACARFARSSARAGADQDLRLSLCWPRVDLDRLASRYSSFVFGGAVYCSGKQHDNRLALRNNTYCIRTFAKAWQRRRAVRWTPTSQSCCRFTFQRFTPRPPPISK